MDTTMIRRLARLLIVVLCTVLVVSMFATTAEAKGRKGKKGKSMRVFGVTRAGQDWYHGRMLVKWRAVRGSSYQMRWSYTPSKLGYSKVIRSGTSGGTYSSTLNRGKTWYFQVRAVRNGVLGPWSAARGLRFVNAWPKAPTISGGGVNGAVQFKWPYTPYASRFRVRWSAAWYGAWPGSASYVDRSSGGWVGQTARKSTYVVPNKPVSGDNMLAVDYANPVFAQVEANNGYRAGASQLSRWVPAFPKAPIPKAGAKVRMGTYNTMVFPTGGRATAVARNISAHELTLVALQESNSASANSVLSALGSAWRAAPSGSGTAQQILYRTDKFRLTNSGSFNVPNPKSPSSPLETPWARFTSISGQKSFYVVSVHFSENSGKSRVEQNRDAGLAAQAAMRGINNANYAKEPVIVAGDMRYGREPYGDPAGYTPAQPTFVRGGYYDAMAAVKKRNYQYATVNVVGGRPSAHQTPHPSGLGPRSDHILFKGFRGSYSYVNAANWSYGGLVPSDHNLVYADLAIPYGS
jgi:hypothetical protein